MIFCPNTGLVCSAHWNPREKAGTTARPCDILVLFVAQDSLEEGKNGRNAFPTGAKIRFSEKNILGLGTL